MSVGLKRPSKKPGTRQRKGTAPVPRARKATTRAAKETTELRVRMYRVGFGDFFLVTIPLSTGAQHVLIDCGVTGGRTGKGDICTIKTAVAHMAAETNGRLALIIATHRHMDHIIGFSRCEDVFQQFKVDAIWMSYWETEYVPEIVKLQAGLTSLALDFQHYLALAGSSDPDVQTMFGVVENATGVSRRAGPGGGTNAKSLELLKTKLGVKPQYLSCGDKPKLPDTLVNAGLEATILGPPPAGALEFMRLMDLEKGVGQFLDAARKQDGGAAQFAPFSPGCGGSPADYPTSAFREWAPRVPGIPPDLSRRYAKRIEEAIAAAQPSALMTTAKQLDDFLNNQSLVVLFTWNGRKLLFAGDAQAGNWEYWLYDLDKPSKFSAGDKLTTEGASILGGLDFYKVGHHGSTNATPIAAVTAMRTGVAAMCSTQEDTFGSEKNASEVPRVPLLKALSQKCAVVRSDQIPVELEDQLVPVAAGAPQALPAPERGRFETGSCYVDYFL
jgi:beta-lactamase superfamily II metal-dependent hydrolase